MKFLELREGVEEKKEQTPNDIFKGQLDQLRKDDTRRSRLTLMHLNKLRKMKELRKAEVSKKAKKIGHYLCPCSGTITHLFALRHTLCHGLKSKNTVF